MHIICCYRSCFCKSYLGNTSFLNGFLDLSSKVKNFESVHVFQTWWRPMKINKQKVHSGKVIWEPLLTYIDVPILYISVLYNINMISYH